MDYTYLLAKKSDHIFSFEQIDSNDYSSKTWIIDISHFEDLDTPSDEEVFIYNVSYNEHGFPPNEVWQVFLSRVAGQLTIDN